MKLHKSLLLASSLFMLIGCNANQGAALSVDNANTYLEPLVENEGNGNFDAATVSFRINPNVHAGKLFSPDIKGKCNVSVKYLLSYSLETGFEWSDSYEIKDVAFTYKEGGTSESGLKTVDYLAASFSYSVDFTFSMVNVYNLNVTEISGHMLP